ncbi:MAG TPA: response regulator, partial [Gillisia sp.]|nr:response regulator [Gillisia sp.]
NITKPIQIDQLFNMLKNIKAPKSEDKILIEHRIEATDFVFNILVAEDNPVNKFLAKTIIKKALPNAIILEASDGQEAVEMFSSKKIDLIFMDVQMPILSGFEATHEIRELEKEGEHIPIIALTARTVKGEKERCQEFGMDDYVTKPVIFNTISDIITKYLIVPARAKEKKSEIQGSGDMHFDKEALMKKLEGDEEAYRELMKMVKTNLEDIQLRLSKSIENQDFDNVRKIAHSLKGTSLNCSFNVLKDLSSTLECTEAQEKVVFLDHQKSINKEIERVLELI